MIINIDTFNISKSVTGMWCIATKLITTTYFNPASQVDIQRMLSDWAHDQGRTVVKREQQEYDVKKKHQKPQIFL